MEKETRAIGYSHPPFYELSTHSFFCENVIAARNVLPKKVDSEKELIL